MLDPARIAPEQPRPLLRREYDRLVELGEFEGERIELLFGTLVAMGSQGARHSATLQRLMSCLVHEVGDRAQVRIKSPFAASVDSEPEADAAVVPHGDYDAAHPDRALLLVEVAETSLSKDLDAKAQLYAQSGVPEYWVIDLAGSCVLVHTDPSPERGAYCSITRRDRAETLDLTQLPGVSIPLDRILR